MKQTLLITLLILALSNVGFAQPNKKPAQKPTSSQPDMNKLLEDAMKAEGMSKEEQEEMKKLMKDVMPALKEVNAKTADYPEFTSNRELIPKKDPARIAAFSKKALAKTEVAGYANGLYAKMMAKGDPAEMNIVKKVVAMTPGAADISGAAVLAMLQGHPQAAMALSIKAVAADPANLNWQNNMGALLTSYGYPEQAMPVLKKLKNELPGNSTVLNNIGQAWLSAGDADSANRYFHAAVRTNPQHHESKTGKGLVEESKGDHEKATRSYEEAMHSSVNPFIDQVRKNNNSSKGKLDFEKIKRNLSIYEYFPKDWMPELPVLHNNVKSYNEDYGMIKGYQKMIRSLGERIEDMSNTLGAELDDLTKKGENEFVNEMMKANMKGLSWMSKPATVVLGVLSAYTTQWHLDYADTLKKIGEWKSQLDTKRQKEIDAIYKQISDRYGTTCQQFKGQLDKLENDYMQQVNTRLRELLVRKAEEYRQWLNAWCTWSWYVTGNTKNIILMQDIGFTQYIAEMYTQIVTSMEVKPEHCNPPVYDAEKKIDPPQIPNFACPTVVHIPSGSEWEGLVAASKDFDANRYFIKKTDKPVPNVSVAYGTASQVAQPGIAPYIKTANGSIAPGNINSNTDDDLVPLTPLGSGDHSPAPGNNGDHEAAETDDLVVPPYYLGQEWKTKQEREKARSQAVKDLLNSLMEPNCTGDAPRPLTKNDKRVIQMLREAADRMRREAEAIKNQVDPKIKMFNDIANDMINRIVKEQVKDAIETYKNSLKDNSEGSFERYSKEFEKILDNINKLKPSALDDVGKGMKAVNSMMERSARLNQGPATLNEISQGGLQATISSGIQPPGTFTPNKTLFQ